MKLFFAKAALYCLPFASILGYPLLLLYGSGELTPLEDAIQVQMQDTPSLLGLAYSNQDKALKLMATQARRPDVLALGNSRVSQFRAAAFREGVSFYNATMSATTVDDFRHILDQIPEGDEPELIILGTDHWFFNAEFWDYDKKPLPERFEPEAADEIFEQYWRTILKEYARGKFEVSSLLRNEQLIGINAKTVPAGFRNDGSVYYGNILRNPSDSTLSDYGFKDTFHQIETANHRWGYGQEVSRAAVEELRRFLQDCAERRIYVVGFMPTYAHAVYEKLQSMPEEYAYLFKVADALAPVFAEHGFEFYDFSDVTWTGSSDAEALDGDHGSEKAHVRMLIKMIEQGSRLGQYIDKAYLEDMLRKAGNNNFEVFDPGIPQASKSQGPANGLTPAAAKAVASSA